MIIHTHLHNDHCENDYKCENAEIFVHVKELERIHNPHPLDYRYAEDCIEDEEENGQIRKIFKDSEILPGLRVFHTPVHTEGGLTVMIDTSGGKAAITSAVLFSSKFFILTIFIFCMFLVFLFDLIHFFFLCQISVRVCEKYN